MTLQRRDIIFPVTLFYDGDCPICVKEIRWLQSLNGQHKLIFENIKAEDFPQRHPELPIANLDKLLHARLGNERIVKGVDATLAAWEAVGQGWMLSPLRWPLFSTAANIAYEYFARNRHRLAEKIAPFIGETVCDDRCKNK
ncbi:DUF393 domain-containing protein [Endozoicomonas sp. Mp262]|uniref:thiol-disulfide oxidoreductase DCC family protein n=1 Tax=Endozoicomonas sp. Mp262 TaxID=2919499 RepID=UPI0021DAB7B7